jgi:lytic murein transglycosylase
LTFPHLRDRPDFDENFRDRFEFRVTAPRETMWGASDQNLALKGFSHARVQIRIDGLGAVDGGAFDRGIRRPGEPALCGGDFATWLKGVKQEAAAQGVSQRTIQSALGTVSYDPGIIARDHAQGVFRQSFDQFAGRMVPPRLARGRRLLQQYGPVLSHIEQQYGVPGAVIVAIWGLETDFGADNGHFPTIRSLVTLAYDCRRPDKFRGEVIAALQIVDRGDMAPSEMRGAWAGEIGQTQFLPSSYLKFAVDYNGDGRRDLIHDVPDVLASTANYLKGYGWQRGQPWGEGTNFQVLLQWNASQVYTKTVAYFAQRLAGGQ